jgi:CBS domain-containing protein
VLTRDDMIKALRERGPDTPVLDVMRSDIPVIGERRNLDEALRLMQEQGLPAVGITNRDGRLLGLITPENIGEMMMVQAARPDRRPPGAPWRTAAGG